MSQIVVLHVKKAPARLSGILQRSLLEIDKGHYAGKATKAQICELWEEVQQTQSSALCVVSTKNEAGFDVWTHGAGRRLVEDNYGIALIKYVKQK